MKILFRKINIQFIISFITLSLCLSGCTKLISIQPPVSSIITSEVFQDSADANSAVLGIYAALNPSGTSTAFGNGSITILTGTSSDELIPFYNSGDYLQIYSNSVTAQTGSIDAYFWQPGYNILYIINACIENISSSSSLTQGTKDKLIGESEFLRGLVNFYLVNLFDNIPLITTTNYKTNALTGQSSPNDIYIQIVSDLTDAQNKLPSDYSMAAGNKVRANRWAATALLSRVYLYEKKWDSAAILATQIINSGNYSLVTPLSSNNDVFAANSSEAILQWNLNTAYYPFNATPEGYQFEVSAQYNPNYSLTPQLLSSFEPGDQRKKLWIDSTVYYQNDSTYYFPGKYKIGTDLAQDNATPTQLYVVLRLAEQYLIRSEAEAELTDLSDAAADLNIIRNRAGLGNISSSIAGSQSTLLQAILHERQIELFGEWGHRWFDLKRTGAIDSTMSIVVPTKSGGSTWQSYQQNYPIPYSELVLNPNLKQNQGY